jgi:type IV pilus assembly protein PilY1
MNIKALHRNLLMMVTTSVTAGFLLADVSGIAIAASPPPQVSISSTPLTVIIPSHPQVLIALTNSNSMDSSDNVTDDGNSSLTNNAPQSAIMTWSGNVGYGALHPTTSPVNYTVPSLFTPPIQSGSSKEPYTAVVDTYTVTGTNPGGNNWTCQHNGPANTPVPAPFASGNGALLKPSGTPPSTSQDPWPSTLTWDDTQVWYYNGINVGGNNGFYEYTDPGTYLTQLYSPSSQRFASRTAIPYGMSAMSPGTMLTGLSDLDYLVSNDTSGGAIPNSTGGGGSGPPPCGTGTGDSGIPCPPVYSYYCNEWKWNPPTTVPYSNTYTYYGDNSPSRLNIAKESIASVLNAYAGSTDFGLMDYSVPSVGGYYTWAYYMSPPGGFTFSNTYSAPTYDTNTPPNLTSEYVMNPCYSVGNGTVGQDCNVFAGELGLTNAQLQSYKFMLVANRSDDPPIDDVFLANSGAFNGYPAFIEDGTITPASPYTGYNLSNYNNNSVQMEYSNMLPSGYAAPYNIMYTYPTNAGYVAYTPQVMYGIRGYLWSGAPSANSGKMLYPTSGAVGTAGSNPTSAEISAFVANFTPFLEPENNVPSTDTHNNANTIYGSAIFANANQSPIAGMLKTAYNRYGPAPSGDCPPPRYVILMTDGLPTKDLAGNNWPPIGSAAANGYGVTATFNADGSLASTNDAALSDAISQLAALKGNGVKTFVIGMGPGVDPTLNPVAAKVLTSMAVAGGTGNASSTGYFPGTNPATVVADLQAILNIISVSNVSSVSAAANSSSLETGTTLYQASYNGYSGAYHDWTGDVKALPVDPTNGVVGTTANWSASCELDAMATGATCLDNTDIGTQMGSGWNSTRLIAFWNPAKNKAKPFTWGNLSSAQQTELQPTDTLGQDRLNYLRGDTVEEIHNGGADGFRDRTHLLGDIVDSAPIYIGQAGGPYTADPTYQTFITNTANRATIYFGANDGMLHAINAATGEEQYAFIPNGVFNNLINLTSSTYNQAHQFFVDGSPSANDVKFAADNNWHTVLVGGLNDGGQSIYALDVTNPSSLTTQAQVASSVLWEFTDSTLGLTYSRPVIAETNVKSVTNANPYGFLVFFGSGYNNSDGNDYLYAVNPETGKQVAKLNLCAAVSGACNTTSPNGLSSPVVINSGGAVGLPDDTVYAGDLQGNLWKINIADANPSNWVVTLLFTACSATCTSTNHQPITVTPAVSLVPSFPGLTGTVVYFGTGQYLGVPDQTTTQTQSFYAILDNGTDSTVTRSALQQQVLTDVAAGTATASNPAGTTTVETRTVTNNAVNWGSQEGWYMNLPDTGERSITDPRLFDGEVVFTTYVPSPGSTCIGGGAAFLMAVNYSNGGSFPQPQLDIDGSGSLNANDELANGDNPVGIGLGQVFASAPDILTTSITGLPVMKLTTLSTGTVANVGERGGEPGQLSWSQIK